MSKQATAARAAEKQSAVTENAAIVVAQTRAVTAGSAISYEEDAAAPRRALSSDDIAIPFLAMLQKNSPQCDPDAGEYMPEAKPGMIYNTVTRELFDGKDTGVEIVPCAYERKFLRWTPREKGGGFRGEVPAAEVVKLREAGIIVEQDNRLYVADDAGNVNPKVNDKIADTRVHYVLVLNRMTGVAQQAVISLASTQIKKSRQLNSLLENVMFDRADGSGKYNPRWWANRVRANSVPESNEKGSWSGWKFEIVGRNEDPRTYAMGRDFERIVMAGKATVNFEAGAAAGAVGEGDDDSSRAERF